MGRLRSTWGEGRILRPDYDGGCTTGEMNKSYLNSVLKTGECCGCNCISMKVLRRKI